MATHPKSPEQIQTQVLEYAHRGNLSGKQRLLIEETDGHIDVAADLVHEKERPLLTLVETGDEAEPYNQWDDDPDKEALLRLRRQRISKQVSRVVVSYTAYVDFMRKGGKELRDDLAFAEEMREAYGEFSPAAHETEGEVASGRGTNKDVHITEHTGHKVAIKRFRGSKSALAVHKEIMAFKRGNSITGAEHMLAASLQDGIIVTEAIDGRTAEEITPHEKQDLPDEHISKAIQTLLDMHAAGLDIDGKLNNFIYSPKDGWHVIDYSREIPEDKNPTPLARKLSYLARAISPLDTANTEDSMKNDRFSTILARLDPVLAAATDTERSTLMVG